MSIFDPCSLHWQREDPGDDPARHALLLERVNAEMRKPMRPNDGSTGTYWPPAMVVTRTGERVIVDIRRARSIAKSFDVPDAVIGIPTARWRRFVQRFTRRATQRAKRRPA